MEGDDGPDYGRVSPTGEATSVLASVGEPQLENASGVGNRDDAGLRGSGEGEQDRSPEEVARENLSSCWQAKFFAEWRGSYRARSSATGVEDSGWWSNATR